MATTGSTNADVAAAARAGHRAGLVRIAEHQGTGKGRLGRQWESPAGACLAISALVEPHAPAATWTWLPLLAGMAVADAVSAAGVAKVGVKWPNDVQADGKKICGVLSELVVSGESRAVVVGMGLNVSLSTDELPIPAATSVLLEGGDPSKTVLTAGILRALDEHLARFDAGDDMATAYAKVCTTLAREVRVDVMGADPVTGTAVGVDSQGRLGVNTPTGLRWFAAGDVHHLR